MARRSVDYSRVPLLAGAYTSRSVIANAQRCVNLYPEANPEDTDPAAPVTHYLTPGLTRILTPNGAVPIRCVYRATNDALYVVAGANVYFVDGGMVAHLMGAIGTASGPVTARDNSIVVVFVDGSASGYWASLAANVLHTIVDAAFYGATHIGYLDGFLIFNRPNTPQFYISPVYWDGVAPFDGTLIQSKTGGPDPIACLMVVHREIWLVGTLTSEVWYASGGVDFPFARLPGVFLDHGCIAPYSLARADESPIWLHQDDQGVSMVLQGANYQVERISTHPIEQLFQSYDAHDAIGFTYQQAGHLFYVLTFPTSDHTWVYDFATQLWHERTWVDNGGAEHRVRANCGCSSFDKVLVGDWQNGNLYFWDLGAYTDDGQPIVRRRGFPHIQKTSKRFSYDEVILDMEVGTDGGQPAPGPPVMLRWSDTRGQSWGDTVPVDIDFGGGGNFYTSLSIKNLGLARDRVFEVFWSFPYETALQGLWLRGTQAET